MRLQTRLLLLCPIVLALFAAPASATTAYYCADTCAPDDTELKFSNAVTAAGLTYTSPVTFFGALSGTTVSNVGATGIDFLGFNGASPDTLNVTGSNQLAQSTIGSGTSIQINFTTPIYAFLLHVTTGSAFIRPCFGPTSNLCDPVLVASGGTGFSGVIDPTTPLTSLTLFSTSFAGGYGQIVISDFRVG
ncbi:MAG: hypothetical protein ABI824_17795, partial [Acidobacteriota bacterium]